MKAAGSPTDRLTMSSHNAFVYDSDDQYVCVALPYLPAGLAEGDAVIVAGTRDRLMLLREALGPDRGRVQMIDAGSLYARPAWTVAAYYKAMVDQLWTVPRVRLFAQVQYGPTPEEWARWGAYEAIATRAFAELPAQVVCTYDAREMPATVAENVWRVHSEVLTDRWHESPHLESPEDTVRRLTPVPRRLGTLRPLAGTDDVAAFRESLAAAVGAERLSRRLGLDVLVAAGELAANAAAHGGGSSRREPGWSTVASSAKSPTPDRASRIHSPATCRPGRASDLARGSGSPASWPPASSCFAGTRGSPRVSGPDPQPRTMSR